MYWICNAIIIIRVILRRILDHSLVKYLGNIFGRTCGTFNSSQYQTKIIITKYLNKRHFLNIGATQIYTNETEYESCFTEMNEWLHEHIIIAYKDSSGICW